MINRYPKNEISLIFTIKPDIFTSEKNGQKIQKFFQEKENIQVRDLIMLSKEGEILWN